ncbi:MAG: hypothetical protein JXL20_05175 [Deltaproteobacteria bacterium]|nr:hypothetical protein [Deltaproteobacteria bacterium]
MSALTDTLYLSRSSRYSSPLNGNDRLPIVYGDHTDGANGIWTLPCIDTDGGGMNPVYCFSAREVLSAANGNGIAIYEDGMELNPALYTFNEADDYEGKGVIATITFTSPKANEIITARGMGKPTTTGGATLMENIIDIIHDFLTVECDFAAALFEASYKARASQVFAAQGYKAAGVISEDVKIWETIVEMMASFLGSAYLDGDGDLCLDIDNNQLYVDYGPAGIVPKSEAPLISTRQRLSNVINQCPCNYAYNYVAGEFKRETNDTAHADMASQGIYGVREPGTPYQFYWCRDLTSVQTVQDIIVAKFKDPVWEIEIEDQTLRRLGVDIGDIIVYSVDWLYAQDGSPLTNNYWRVVGVTRDFDAGTIRFRALQMPYYLTAAYLADGTYLADGSVKAGFNRDLTIF